VSQIRSRPSFSIDCWWGHTRTASTKAYLQHTTITYTLVSLYKVIAASLFLGHRSVSPSLLALSSLSSRSMVRTSLTQRN
jgi:hypothetical protein